MNSDQMYLNEGRGVINCAYGAFFIGPESDHWQCLSLTDSLTDSLTHCCLVNFIDMSLACEDGNSKLVEVAFLDWNQIV